MFKTCVKNKINIRMQLLNTLIIKYVFIVSIYITYTEKWELRLCKTNKFCFH